MVSNGFDRKYSGLGLESSKLVWIGLDWIEDLTNVNGLDWIEGLTNVNGLDWTGLDDE